ncbi:hypothetical protein [Paenibacillus xylaniclasticus]|uniref:hypothetical protein n=1 Tax=Paenibacillus xylaniclasticus TaxID=588083 RepID=UPI000FD7E96B|nr:MULTISPECIES: hypothetical protein [Paenibacillus]GFN30747.1 hypothetical protein PCURB6_10070 [Paenibacillus curdlanolyticus]
MLVITSMSCIGPWGETIESFVEYCKSQTQGNNSTLPEDRHANIPPVPGFIESSFNPLVYRTIQYYAENDRIRDRSKLAIILGSTFGDTATADLASRNLLSGRLRNPLLFYQSVPNSILGYASSQYQMTEMFTCITYSGGAAAALLEMAELYLAMPEVEQVLVIGVETQSERADEMYMNLTTSAELTKSMDNVVSLMLENGLTEQAYAERAGSIWVREITRTEASENHLELEDVVSCPIRVIGNEGLLNIVLAAEQLNRQDAPDGSSCTVLDDTFGGDQYAITLVRGAHVI